jgi:hypothetical protein
VFPYLLVLSAIIGLSCEGPLMLLAQLFADEHYDKSPATDSRATLGAGVHRFYLPAPLDVLAWAEVQTGQDPQFFCRSVA